jgi:hypothetical protein
LNGSETAGLSPSVADLIERVEAKMATAPTVAQIRSMTDEALADPSRPEFTLAEIRELTDVAIGRARKVEDYAARLAGLLAGDAR